MENNLNRIKQLDLLGGPRCWRLRRRPSVVVRQFPTTLRNTGPAHWRCSTWLGGVCQEAAGEESEHQAPTVD